MAIHIFPTPQEVIRAVADHIVTICNQTLQLKTDCNLVLSGGSSPKELYRLLAGDEYRDRVDWQHVYFFFGDERFVPFSDPDNNGRMAKEELLDPLHIPDARIFYIDTSLSPEAAAEDYEKKIHEHFKNEPVSFDIILLGLGDNAHTASLFPGTEIINEKRSGVSAVFVSSLHAYRITMTAKMINDAKNVIFLLYGKGKAEAVKQILQGSYDPMQFPAQLIKPTAGETEWFLDSAAASTLDPSG